METLLHFLLQRGVLSPTHYWHLRLLSAVALGPLLAILYLVCFGRRNPRTSNPRANSGPTMWVGADGRLVVRRPRTPA